MEFRWPNSRRIGHIAVRHRGYRVKRILITGGCGFIGRNLIKKLLQRGDRVRVLDNLSVGTRNELAQVAAVAESMQWTGARNTAALVVGDIRDRGACARALDGADAVVHLAAQSGVIPSMENPLFDCETNVMGLVNVLQGCVEHGARQLVFASSSAPLGETVPPIHEEMVPKPLSPYGASKLAGEGYCSAYYHSFDIRTTALRFSNVYGPLSSHKGSVVALFFRRAMEGKPLIVYGSGAQTRDFIYIDDLCGAIMGALDSDVGGEIFQIATFKENTVNRIAELVKDLVERDTQTKVEIIYEGERKGEVRRSFSDISKAKRLIGYQPVMSLEEGMELTWQWFQENYKA